MHKLILLFMVFALFGNAMFQSGKNKPLESGETEAIIELPFCALVLRNYLQTEGREIHILIEPKQVSEPNLILLFRTISAKYPDPLELIVWVRTNVIQLAELATGVGPYDYLRAYL